MTISLRLSEKDAKLIKDYAKLNNISVSDLFRQTVIERIEDEIDLEAYNKAYEEYLKDPKTYTLEEVKKELGL